MNSGKKILTLIFKIALGLTGAYIIYLKLKHEFEPEQMLLLSNVFHKTNSLLLIFLSFILIPVNWGLESAKWLIITKKIESISYPTALRSIYSGIFLGNFSPGRATEFLGKILFFSDENKSRISVLHFVNGMIQLSITLLFGLVALAFKLDSFSKEYNWLVYLLSISSSILFVFLIVMVFRVNYFLTLVTKFFSSHSQIKGLTVPFPLNLWLKLVLLSFLRYITFGLQFFLLLKVFASSTNTLVILPGIALYFMMTSLLPMISILEAAIRAAIAMLVLADSGISSTLLALATILLWLFNIVLPSIIGYIVLVQFRFDFKLIFKQKTR